VYGDGRFERNGDTCPDHDHVLAVMWMVRLTLCARIMWWHGLGRVWR
jgi:hypothetical protein